MAQPDYSNYSLYDLCQSLNAILEDHYPETYQDLIRNINERKAISRAELEECWFLLDKERRPEFAKWLREQIDAQGGFTAQLRAPKIDKKVKQKKPSLWRRFRSRFGKKPSTVEQTSADES